VDGAAGWRYIPLRQTISLWLEARMISWEMATILILLAYILGLMTAIRLLKA
jgi:hypothetical protein